MTGRRGATRRALSSPTPQPTSSTTPSPRRATTSRYPASCNANNESGVDPCIGRSPVSFTLAILRDPASRGSHTTGPAVSNSGAITTPGTARNRRGLSFGVALGAIASVGLGVRLVAIYTHGATLAFSDPLYYYATGRSNAHRLWFINAVQYYFH